MNAVFMNISFAMVVWVLVWNGISYSHGKSVSEERPFWEMKINLYKCTCAPIEVNTYLFPFAITVFRDTCPN